MTPPHHWTCPHCNRTTTITFPLYDEDCSPLSIGPSKFGSLGIAWKAVRCPSLECNDFVIDVKVGRIEPPPSRIGTQGPASGVKILESIVTRRLRPEGISLPQPDYIPKQIRDDYYEACLIRDLSPKAAAALARRCLQGIIRDFWNIQEATLHKEIAVLQSQIEASLWSAIDAVRSVGNIGAHMEKDVNKIIDIEPEEAAKLIGLVEVLFKEWYVARHEREERLRELSELATQKAKERKK